MNLDYFENKEKIYKIIYSQEFYNSIYKIIYNIDINIDNFVLILIKDLKNKNDQNIEYFNDNLNIYKLVKITLNEPKYIYLYNYLFKVLIPMIEQVYSFDIYTLYLKNIYYSLLTPVSSKEFANIKNEQIINFKTNTYEFIVLINLGNDFNIIIDTISYTIETNKSIVFSNKHLFDIENFNGQNILILNISILNGYNRYEYNKHPNQN
jgi:hypothetical protein